MPNDLRFRASIKDDVSGPLDRIKDKFSMVKKQGVTGFGLGVGAAVATAGINSIGAATDILVDGVVKSISAASDLNETLSKSSVIFGDNADEMAAWADEMDDAAGISKRAALDAASGFAGLFKTVGLGIDESTQMSRKLTQLGSDLASFFNTDVEEALGALKSGLNGESEPLRRFNVFLSETAVAAKLAEMGIKKTGAQFTEAQKATARYALILEQTGDAQGDFARTSDGMANSSRQLDAKLENLSARVGGVLLPVVEDATTGLLGMADAIDTVTDSAAPAGDKIDVFADALEFVNGTLTGMGGAFDAYGEASAAAADAAEEAAYESAKAWDTGSERVGMALGNIRSDATRARTGFDRLDRKTRDLVGDFKDLKTWADRAGDALAEASYGPEELELAFEGAKLELKENQREVKRVQDKLDDLEKKGKKAPLSLKREFNDAEQAVNDSKQEVIRLGTRLRITDNISMADLRSQFSRLGIRINTTEGQARDLWYYLNLIANADLGTAYDNQKQGIGGRASGGPVLPGTSYIVGENGPEVLHMGSGSGVISPGLSSAQGGGGGMTLIVQTPVLTPGGAQALADAIAPAITRWQQQRGL